MRAESSGELPTGGIRALFFRWEALTRRRFGEEELQGSAAGRAVSGTRRSLAQVPAASTEGSAIWLPGHPEPGTASTWRGKEIFKHCRFMRSCPSCDAVAGLQMPFSEPASAQLSIACRFRTPLETEGGHVQETGEKA